MTTPDYIPVMLNTGREQVTLNTLSLAQVTAPNAISIPLPTHGRPDVFTANPNLSNNSSTYYRQEVISDSNPFACSQSANNYPEPVSELIGESLSARKLFSLTRFSAKDFQRLYDPWTL